MLVTCKCATFRAISAISTVHGEAALRYLARQMKLQECEYRRFRQSSRARSSCRSTACIHYSTTTCRRVGEQNWGRRRVCTSLKRWSRSRRQCQLRREQCLCWAGSVSCGLSRCSRAPPVSHVEMRGTRCESAALTSRCWA